MEIYSDAHLRFFALAVLLFVLLYLLLPRTAKPSKLVPSPSPSSATSIRLLLPLGKNNPLHRSLASLSSLHGGALLVSSAAVELFSPAQLSASAQIRADEAVELVKALARASGGRDRRVVMKPRLFAMAMNVMMRMIAGKRYYGGGGQGGELGLAGSEEEEEEARRFQEIVERRDEFGGFRAAA